jgi:hypothetical protein
MDVALGHILSPVHVILEMLDLRLGINLHCTPTSQPIALHLSLSSPELENTFAVQLELAYWVIESQPAMSQVIGKVCTPPDFRNPKLP